MTQYTYHSLMNSQTTHSSPTLHCPTLHFLTSTQHNIRYTICNSQRRQHWIDTTASRKNTSIANEQILTAPSFTVFINNTLSAITAHTTRTHLMRTEQQRVEIRRDTMCD